MMTSTQIRQSFLDFFKSKQHTIVPSSSLLPDSPNLLFTNAGMNQFVPIFLGQTNCPYTPGRAADTQKCIRAGGKHNDLDDVGLDTYHHTFFEMLGNWSFGDYFKKEAIDWAWELVVQVWKFPPSRLYATVFCPYLGQPGWEAKWRTELEQIVVLAMTSPTYIPPNANASPFEIADQEAAMYWAKKFSAVGCDPKTHIVPGNKKDNFWMMGETGPCGPCTEIHVDLTPAGDTKGALVNQGDARCIEIWNNVFIQFNAQPVAAVCDRRSDGEGDRRSQTAATVEYVPLAAKHVDTGMGFERVTSIIQGTKNLTDFQNARISNYETDIFRPIFDALEKMSGKKYGSTLPNAMGSTGDSPVPQGYQPGGMGTMPLSSTTAGSQTDAPSHSAGQVAQRDGLVARATETVAPGATYSKRNLPHFEKPWAIYHVIINTIATRKLSPAGRDLVFDCILNWRESRYRLVAASVMPDHAHFIIQPGVKEEDAEGNPVFWPLSDILHSIKSYSAKEINKLDHCTGTLWQEERYDRYMRSDLDLQEKFHYVCRNPWTAGLVKEDQPWPWLWTPEIEAWKPYVALSARQGSTGDSPVPVGDPPTGRGGTSPLQSTVDANAGAPLLSAGLVAQRHGPVARATQEQVALDIAFRVIGDHIRTLSFAIADGIQPGNNDRNYVLRRILRRAVRYGRTLGFKEPFFYKLVDVLAETMGDVFPEIRARKKQVQDTIRIEEEAFNKTLDKGIELIGLYFSGISGAQKILSADYSEEKNSPLKFQATLAALEHSLDQAAFARQVLARGVAPLIKSGHPNLEELNEDSALLLKSLMPVLIEVSANETAVKQDLIKQAQVLPGNLAFVLYDTYGFPLDLTELMARERGLTVDKEGFEKLMEEQRNRARAAQKKEVISLSQIETTTPTKFVGYEDLAVQAKVLEVVSLKDKTAVILDTSACYAEMGGQVGDTGEIFVAADGSQPQTSPAYANMAAFCRTPLRITNTQKSGNTFLHFVDGDNAPSIGEQILLRVDKSRRDAIQRHHTVTHLLHWALHEVASKEASQKGSFVGPDKLTFDFNSAPLTPAQVAGIEKLVNERILENAPVSWTEVAHADVKNRRDVMQFFGDKYGDTVRVVQIGGGAGELDGYSMELCGGTHARATGEIGLFRILGESAIAAGVRRIEAVAGLEAYGVANQQLQLIRSLAGKINSPVGELEKKIEALLAHQKELERQVKSAQQREASNAASELLERVQTINGTPAIIHNVGGVDGDFLQAVVDSLKGRFPGVIVLGGAANGAVALVAAVSADFTAKIQAGKIIQQIAPIVGGKGGGKPDNARGGGKDATKLDEALAKAKSLLG